MSKKLIRSSLIVLAGTLLYKLAFLLKDILLTSKLGVSEELNLFVAAFLIPSFLCNTLAQSLQVSASNEIVKQSNTLHFDYLINILKKTISMSICFFLILNFSLPFLFQSFNTFELNTLRITSLISLPFFIFTPVRGVMGQILYLRNKHLINFSLALVSPTFLIAYLVVSPEPKAMEQMVCISVGSFFEMLAVYFVTKRFNGIVRGNLEVNHIPYRFIFRGLILQFLIMLPPLIDQLYAHLSGARFLTVFNYAIKIPNIITTISMIIAASVLLPFFLENKDKLEAKIPDKKRIIGVFLLLSLFYGAIPFLSPIIVKIIYERGKFSPNDSFEVGLIQTYYFLSVPLTASFMVYIRYLNAHEKNLRAIWLAFGVAICTLGFGYFWSSTGRFQYIPFSIVGSYFVTISTFLIWKKIKSNDI